MRIAQFDASTLAANLQTTQQLKKDPWQVMMTARIESAPLGATYYAVPDQLDSVSELLEDGAGTTRIHHASWSKHGKASLELLIYTIGMATLPQVVRISALESTMVDPLANALSLQPHPMRLQSRSCCGMYMRVSGSDLPSLALPLGFALRALRPDDASTLDARWQYRSDSSLQMVNSMLHGQRAGNIGIEDENGELAGCASARLAPFQPLVPMPFSDY